MEKIRPKVISAALVESNGKYLLIKEVLENNKEYWIVPGGSVEFGETIEQAAVREIKEETNLDVEITKFLGFKEAISVKHKYHTVIFFYLAKPLHKDVKLEGKVLEARFVDLDEARSLNLVESAKWLFERLKMVK
jgi:8-oxo-dGTP diphosphatase